MTSLSSAVETIDHPDSDPDDGEDDSWTETILTISVTGKTVDEMREHLSLIHIYIHTVIGPCGFHRKHCHDLPPVRWGAVYDNLVVVPGLQFLQLTSVFHIDLGDGRTERHRGTVSRLVGEQDTKGGGD